MSAKVIIKPIITEKVTAQSEKLNKYGFVVDRKATKDDIRDAVEKLYGVKVESVNTMILGGGKPKQKYTTKGIAFERRPVHKKAIVTVAEGEVIDLYSNI
jgi:large subunit ribosomal protein L23